MIQQNSGATACGGSGAVAMMRRNIVLQKYSKYNIQTIQNEIFDRIFINVDDQPRLTLEQLIEVGSLFLLNTHKQVNIPERKQDTGVKNTEDEEVIEDDYYYEDDDGNQQETNQFLPRESDQKSSKFTVEVMKQSKQQNNYGNASKNESDGAYSSIAKTKKKQFKSTKGNGNKEHVIDESNIGSDSEDKKSEIPLFDNLPSLRSNFGDDNSKPLADSSNKNKYNQYPDFNNLPSVRSSIVSNDNAIRPSE